MANDPIANRIKRDIKNNPEIRRIQSDIEQQRRDYERVDQLLGQTNPSKSHRDRLISDKRIFEKRLQEAQMSFEAKLAALRLRYTEEQQTRRQDSREARRNAQEAERNRIRELRELGIRKAREEREAEQFLKRADVKEAIKKSPYLEELLKDPTSGPNVRKAFEQNPQGMTERSKTLNKYAQRDDDEFYSTSVTKRVSATFRNNIERAVYGMFGVEGQARRWAKRASTKEEAAIIKREYRYRHWANFLEDNFGAVGGAYALRLRNKITHIKSTDDATAIESLGSSVLSMAQQFEQLYAKIGSHDKAIADIVKLHGIDPKSNSKLPIEKIDAAAITPDRINELESTQQKNREDIDALIQKVEALRQLVNAKNDGVSKAELERLKKELQSRKKDDAPSEPPSGGSWWNNLKKYTKGAGIGAGAMAFARYGKYMKNAGALARYGVVGYGAYKLADSMGVLDGPTGDAEKGKALEEGTSDQRWSTWLWRNFTGQNARDKMEYYKKQRDEKKPPSGEPIPPSLKGMVDVKKAGMMPGLQGFWDSFTGATTRNKLADMKQRRNAVSMSSNPYAIQTIDDRIYRNQVEMQKSRFMQYGALPTGFEFIPGHMGRLGQANAWAAGGAQPLSDDYQIYPGGLGTGDAPYSSGGGGSGNPELARLATSEDAKKVIAQAVQGNIPLTSAVVDRALKLEGLHERGDRDVLKEFLKQGGRGIDPAQTPWCAAFVNSAMAGAGIYGTGSFVATSYLNWGELKQAAEVQRGDVLVEARGRGAGQTGGHVGLATGEVKRDSKGNITHVKMLGGNQSNKVTEKWTPVGAVTVRRATEREMSPEAAEAMTKITGKPFTGTPAATTGGLPNATTTTGNRNTRVHVPADGRPASERYNNPGAAYPSKADERYGLQGYGVIGGGHLIGKFPTAVHGAAANFALWERGYVGLTLQEAVNKWRGGNGSLSVPAGFNPSMKLTKEQLRDTDFMVSLFKGMAKHEAGRGGQLTEEQWKQAHSWFLSGGAPSDDPNTVASSSPLVNAPKLTGVPYMPVSIKPEIDPKSAFSGDSVLPSLKMPTTSPDVLGERTEAEVKRIDAESDAIGTEFGRQIPTDDMRPMESITPPPTPAPVPNEMDTYEQQTNEEIKQMTPNLDYAERTGIQPKPSEHTAGSNQSGNGGRNNPETAPATPGSGGRGAMGRCFI